MAEGERPLNIDVMIVVDVSGSTSAPSGVDVDGDGDIGLDPEYELVVPGTYPPGTKNTDPGDSILAAEIEAGAALIKTLDPTRVRVGIVSFSGMTGDPNQSNAWLVAALR